MAGETGAGAPSTHSVLAGPPIGFFIFWRSKAVPGLFESVGFPAGSE